MNVDGNEVGRAAEPTIVDSWLEPLSDSACGEDLEYDNEFLELLQAAEGKPETQFGPATPPDWRAVRSRAEGLMERTRDLRVAIFWARSGLAIEGAPNLSEGLRLIHGLLENFWDELFPRLDDGDAYARINAISDMCGVAGLRGDLRHSLLIKNRAVGELRVRDVEIALGLIEARDDESAPGRAQIEQMLSEACNIDPGIAVFPGTALSSLEKLSGLMRERVGFSEAPELSPLIDVIAGIQGLLPTTGASSGSDNLDGGSEVAPASGALDAPRRGGNRGSGLGSAIETREDALRAIDMVCAYLERAEPTNPAQLLLRRARKLVNKNFLELMRELAPDALNEVARIMGVSPDDVGSDS